MNLSVLRSHKKLNDYIFGEILVLLAAGMQQYHSYWHFGPNCYTTRCPHGIPTQITLWFHFWISAVSSLTITYTLHNIFWFIKTDLHVTYLIQAILVNLIASTEPQLLPSSQFSSNLWILCICRVKISIYTHALPSNMTVMSEQKYAWLFFPRLIFKHYPLLWPIRRIYPLMKVSFFFLILKKQ